MFGFRIVKVEEKKRSIPWLSLGCMVLLTLLFGWSQWGLSSKTKAVNQAKEKLLCFFLKHDYTIIPAQVQKHLPKEVQKHARRVAPYVEYYYRGGMAREQARQWLSEGDWTRYNASPPPKGMTCLQFAIRQGQLSRHPKKRLYMSMASHSPQTLENYQKDLQKLGQIFLHSRLNHPWYGWGLVPADKSPISWVTSNAIAPGFLNLLLHLLLLWMFAGFLERAWGGPIWLALYGLGGVVGNLFLTLFLSGSKQPILGGSLALATVVGMWAFATLKRPIQVWSQGLFPTEKLPTVPSWSIVAGWFALSLLETLSLGYPIVSYTMAQILCFALGAGVLALFQHLEWLEELPMPVAARISSARKQHQTRPQPVRTFKKAKPGTKSMYLKPDLKQMVKKSYQNEEYSKAINGYRELYKTGQARIDDFDELFLACEKGNIAPEPDDFLRAIRVAAFAQNQDKARAYYKRCNTKRPSMHWSQREQISLAQELKRAEMFEESLKELEVILDEGPDGVSFMDALILKTETLIAEGKELERAAQLIYQAELYLEQNPTYKESVGRLRLLLSDKDGSSIPEIRTIPKGLGSSALETEQVSGEEDQVDESLLENFDLFDQKLESTEKVASGGSWDELPSLLLRDKLQNKFLDEPTTTNPDFADDDDFLWGGEENLSQSESLAIVSSPMVSDSLAQMENVSTPHESLTTASNPALSGSLATASNPVLSASLAQMEGNPALSGSLAQMEGNPALSGSLTQMEGISTPPESLATASNPVLSVSFAQMENVPNPPESLATASSPVLSASFAQMDVVPEPVAENGSQEMTLLAPHRVEELLGQYSDNSPLLQQEPVIAHPTNPDLSPNSDPDWDSSWNTPSIVSSTSYNGLQESSSDSLIASARMPTDSSQELGGSSSFGLLIQDAMGKIKTSQHLNNNQTIEIQAQTPNNQTIEIQAQTPNNQTIEIQAQTPNNQTIEIQAQTPSHRTTEMARPAHPTLETQRQDHPTMDTQAPRSGLAERQMSVRNESSNPYATPERQIGGFPTRDLTPRPRLSSLFKEAVSEDLRNNATPRPQSPTIPQLGVEYKDTNAATLEVQIASVESLHEGVPVSLYPQAQAQVQAQMSPFPHQSSAIIGTSVPHHSAMPILELTDIAKDDHNND